MRPGRLALIYRSGALSLMAGIVFGYLTFFVSLFGTSVLWFLYGPSKPPAAASTPTLALTSLLLGFGVFGVFLWRCRRQRQLLFRELWPHRLAVCPTCIYPLMRHRERCSECGREIKCCEAQQFWVGVFWMPIDVMWPEGWVIRRAAQRRRNRGWSRRHFGRWFKWYRPRSLLPLR